MTGEQRMANTVWILGSANIDTTYRVKILPGRGETLTATTCVTATGGKGANQACAAAHCGAHVSFIGAVGRDDMGEALLDALRRRDIGTDCVTRADMNSGNAVIYVDDHGANCIVVYPGANRAIPTDMPADFAPGDILAAQLEINMDAVEAYFARAKACGATTVLNPSPYTDIPAAVLSHTDLIIANETEAGALGGGEVSDAASAKACAGRILALGPKAVVVTLGEHGAILCTAEGAVAADGYRVTVADTQGAGDAFLGAFAARLAAGSGFEAALRFANAVGALAVTVHGSTQVSMPVLERVWNMLDNAQ